MAAEWIPVIASSVVAVASLVGISATLLVTTKENQNALRKTLEQSQKSLDAARLLELEKWRRDTLVRILSSAIETTIEIGGDLAKSVVLTGEEQAIEHMSLLDANARKLGALAGSLRVIGAHEEADACVKIRHVVNESVVPVSAFVGAAEIVKAGRQADDELVRSAKQQLNRVISDLESARGYLIEVGQTSLKQTLN